MITVMDLLSQPIFSQFKLVSGRAGLHNVVSGTGIFEWESFEDMDSTFEEGEFIVTTLSQAKGDIGKASQCLANLLHKNVSSISIKSVYFTEISPEVQALSEEKKIPIFFFANTFFDDIIFIVKTALLSNLPGTNFSEKIHVLLEQNLSNKEIRHIAKEINPFFFEYLTCAYSSFRGDSTDAQQKLKALFSAYCLQESNTWLDPTVSVYSLIPLHQGIFVIFTESKERQDATVLTELLRKIGLTPTNCHIGLSNWYFGLENLAIALKESVYAHTSCFMDKEGILSFSQTGLDQLLIPSRNENYTQAYYHLLLEKMETHDTKHQIELMDTLLEYAACGNDIQLTAQKTFQHSNTIRYRLDKVKKIFGIEDNAEFHRQLYVFCRLHNIYQYLKDF